MNREFKIYCAAFACMFLLRAAAPIALNGGSPTPYDGGTLSTPALVPDGTISAPGISFAGDTNLGWYRSGADVIRLGVDGVKNFNATGTANQTWLAVTAGSWYTNASAPAIRANDADSGLYMTSAPGIHFVDDGTAIAHLSYSASSRASLCLSSSANTSAPCILPDATASSANFGFVQTNASTYTGTLDLSSGDIRGNSTSAAYPNMTFAANNTTGLYGGNSLFGAGTFSSSVHLWSISSSNDGLTQTSANTYIRIAQKNGAPDAGDCVADSERGRMSLDYLNHRLYICDGASNGWGYLALSDT